MRRILTFVAILLSGCAATPAVPKDAGQNITNVGASQASTGTGITGGINILKQIKATPTIPQSVPALCDAGISELTQAVKDNLAGVAAFNKVQADFKTVETADAAKDQKIDDANAKIKKLDSQFFSPRQISIYHWFLAIIGIMGVCWIFVQIAPMISGPWGTALALVGHIGTLAIPTLSKLLSGLVQKLTGKITGTLPPQASMSAAVANAVQPPVVPAPATIATVPIVPIAPAQ